MFLTCMQWQCDYVSLCNHIDYHATVNNLATWCARLYLATIDHSMFYFEDVTDMDDDYIFRENV